MGTNERCSPLTELLDCFLYLPFGFRIEGRCGLIEQDNLRLPRKRSCDCDALLLSTGALNTSFTNYCVVPIREGRDLVVDSCSSVASRRACQGLCSINTRGHELAARCLRSIQAILAISPKTFMYISTPARSAATPLPKYLPTILTTPPLILSTFENEHGYGRAT